MQPGILGSESVYDPFVGSGATGMVAHQLGRAAWGVVCPTEAA
jgi:DNA modification methylase